jgi:hypothetical protein
MTALRATGLLSAGNAVVRIAACLIAGALLAGVIAGCGGAGHRASLLPPRTRAQRSAAQLTTTAVVTVVKTVPFAPVTSEVHNDCAYTARTVGYAVPCPKLLPLGMEATEPVHGCQFRIVAPVGWPGCAGVRPNGWFFGSGDVIGRGAGGPGFQHLVLFAAPRLVHSPARAVDGPTVFPEPVQRRGLIEVDGLRMTFYMVPMDNPSAFRGHLVLLWAEHGHTYVYGFHVTGTIEAARALDLEVVHHLETVAP